MTEVIISSSFLIAVILFIRKLFRGKVSHRLLYCAWLPVAARLLIPFQFGQFALSIHNLIQKIEAHSPSVHKAQEILQLPVGGPSADVLREEVVLKYEQLGFDTASETMQSQITAEVEALNNAPTLGQILFWVWIAGTAVMAVWFLVTNLVFLSRVRKGSVPFPWDAPVPVRISPNVSTPCLVGLFRPVIYLTRQVADNPTMVRHVLSHELTHRRHGDPVWSLLRCLCLCIHWFNPLVWLAARESRRDCELACDEGTLHHLGEAERFSYGETLIATVSISHVHLLSTATAMNESAPRLKERMSFIVKKPNNILLAAIAILLVAAIATGCAFAGSVSSSSTEPPSTESTVTTDPPETTQPTPSGQETTQPTPSGQETTQGPPPTTEPPVTKPSSPSPDKLYFNNVTEQDELYGDWIGHVRLSEAEPLSYHLRLYKDGTAEYSLGLYGSDLIEHYTGTWKPAGEPYGEECYTFSLTGKRCSDDSEGQEYPSFNYYGIIKLETSNDHQAIRATWIDGNYLFKFYNTRSLLMYRLLEDQKNYYDIPIQTIVVSED